MFESILRRRTLYPAELYPHMSDFCVLLGLFFVLGTIWVQFAFLVGCDCLKLCVILGVLAIFVVFNAILRRLVISTLLWEQKYEKCFVLNKK